MKRLSITQLVPGMTVAEDVYDLDHELLIQKGTILTDKLITKLDLYGILTIFVEDIIQPVRPAEDSTDTEFSYSERIKSSPEFQLFKTDFENDVELFRENMNLVIQKNTSLDVNTLLKNTMAIVANHSGSISILDMLQNMREYDDSTYTHSLNVALICNILAGWLKLSDEEIELATACGLFHDIGKLLIPYSIISKPVQSVHKTLPSLTQTALLHIKCNRPRKNLQRSKSIPPWVTSFSCPRMWMIM